MSAVGRLWRRAPAWRVCVMTAAAATALAAMFPPSLPKPFQRSGDGLQPLAVAPRAEPASGTQPARQAAARFVPQPAPANAHTSDLETPPPGPGRSGIIPFAGRFLPLPEGSWQDLVLARFADANGLQVSVLGRIDGTRLTGLMFGAAPTPVGGAPAPITLFEPCYAPGIIVRETVPAQPEQALLVHECWTLAVADLAGSASQKTGELLQPAFRRLAQLGVSVPDRMLALRYTRSASDGWMMALLLLPDPKMENAAVSRRVQAWAKRYAVQFRKGFDRTLTPAEVAPTAHPPV
jgi:hypothetical protein